MSKVQIINLVEPFIELAIVQITMWTTNLDPTVFMLTSLISIGIWTLFISPWVHFKYLKEGDIYLPPEHNNFKYFFFQARGIGNPWDFYSPVEEVVDENIYKEVKTPPKYTKYWPQIKYFMILENILAFYYLCKENVDYNKFIISILGTSSYLIQLLVGLVLFPIANALVIYIALPVFMRLDNYAYGMRTYFFDLFKIAMILMIIMGIMFQVNWDWFVGWLGEHHPYSLKPPTPLIRAQTLTFVKFISKWIMYIVWGWVQQLLFLSCFTLQLARGCDAYHSVTGKYVACFISGLFFGSLHVPSYWLSFSTFVFGNLWGFRFLDAPNLLVFGTSHGMLATTLEMLLPIEFRVGPRS